MYKYRLNSNIVGSGTRNVNVYRITPDLKFRSDHYKSQIAAPPALLNEITKIKSYPSLLYVGSFLML